MTASPAGTGSGPWIRFELFAEDPARSVAFWTGVLGFEVERADDSYTSVRSGEVVIGIGRVDQLPPTAPGPGFDQERVRAGRGAGVEIVLEVEDLDAFHAQVVATGWPVAEQLQRRPWGLRDFRVGDPDGYYVRVTHRP